MCKINYCTDDSLPIVNINMILQVNVFRGPFHHLFAKETVVILYMHPSVQLCKMDRSPEPNASIIRRRRHRLDTYHFLVKFKTDSVLHVCNSDEVVYRKRKRDSKIVAYGLYRGVWYECNILHRHVDRDRLRGEVRAAKTRTAQVLSGRGRKGISSFVLVQFHVTRDYQVLPVGDVQSREAETADCLINCSDGGARPATFIAEGGELSRFLQCFSIF